MKIKWAAYFITSNLIAAGLAGLAAAVISGAFGRQIGYIAYYALFGLAGIVASVLTGIWASSVFTGKITGHLKSIAWGAESLSRGDLSFRLPPSPDKELQSISDSFNHMAARIETQVKTLQSLTDENAELMLQTSEAAALDERRRLASDLHDAVSQQLFSINMSISAALRLFPKNPDAAFEQMEFVKDMALRAQSEMRALLMHLRPVSLNERSFKDAAQVLLLEIQAKNNIRCEANIEDIELPKGVEDNLFRILQEAVANTIKHASAESMKVNMLKTKGRIYLSVEDDGVGMPEDTNRQTSYGLKTMVERAEKVGGTVDMISLPGRGTRIEVRVPLD